MLLERSAVLDAKPYERTSARKGYANGFESESVHTPIGTLCLDIPQVRGDIEFYPSALQRYSRTDKALLLTMAEMYVQGASTRKVDKVLSNLCGLRVSSSQVSRASGIIAGRALKRPSGYPAHLFTARERARGH
jgi:putative transposase